MIEEKQNEIIITGKEWLKKNHHCQDMALYFFPHKNANWIIKAGMTRLLIKKLKENWNWEKTWCIAIGNRTKEIRIFKNGKIIVYADKEKQKKISDSTDTKIDEWFTKYIDFLCEKKGYAEISKDKLREKTKEKNEESSFIKEFLNSEKIDDEIILHKEAVLNIKFDIAIFNWQDVYILYMIKVHEWDINRCLKISKKLK